MSNCSPFGGFQLIHDNDHFFKAYINLIENLKEKTGSEGIRWITYIDDNKEQINLIRKFLQVGIKIRHVNNLPPLYFTLSEKQFQATIEKMDEGNMVKSLLYNTEPTYIQHFKSLFEKLWKSGIDGE